MQVTWQQNISDPDNADNLAAIAQWWHNLDGKEISWQQRLISDISNLEEVDEVEAERGSSVGFPDQEQVSLRSVFSRRSTFDWEPQKFDEKFLIQSPQLRGITVYWQKNNDREERNITARKLELDRVEQKLYIYPQSQEQVVICVSTPQVIYQIIEINNPQIVGKAIGDNYLLLLRDPEQKLDIKVNLDSRKLTYLLERLNDTTKP